MPSEGYLMVVETQRYPSSVHTDVREVRYDHWSLKSKPNRGPEKHMVAFSSLVI